MAAYDGQIVSDCQTLCQAAGHCCSAGVTSGCAVPSCVHACYVFNNPGTSLNPNAFYGNTATIQGADFCGGSSCTVEHGSGTFSTCGTCDHGLGSGVCTDTANGDALTCQGNCNCGLGGGCAAGAAMTIPDSPPSPPPPSPPSPPSPPAPPAQPALATVGDDPVFVGGDGRPYEVRGDAGSFFNLLSAAALSVNAQFVRVPEQFRAEDVTDTVLGDVSLSMCAGGCEARVSLNVSTGAVRQNALPSADGDAAACGLSVEEEAYVCDLRSMECAWRPAEEAAARLPLLPLGHTRLAVRGAGVRLMLTRHAMTDLDGEIDCSRVRAWPAASAACDRLSTGGHALDDAARLSLLLRSAMDAPVRRFYFMELGVASLGGMAQQAELHGLLGQRALLAAPAAEMLAPTRADEPTAIAVGVGARGGTHALVGGFGSQGEGAIEGVYTDYEIGGLHEHGGFRFSRWQICGATPAPSQI